MEKYKSNRSIFPIIPKNEYEINENLMQFGEWYEGDLIRALHFHMLTGESTIIDLVKAGEIAGFEIHFDMEVLENNIV